MNEIATSKSYHHGNLRAELLDTAIEQLREAGVEDLSLRALARAIGVSQTAPYRHFGDKSELLAAMATCGYRDLLDALRRAGAATGDCPQEQLFAFAHAYVDYAARNPQLFKLMFGPAVQPTVNIPSCVKPVATPCNWCRTSCSAAWTAAYFDTLMTSPIWLMPHGPVFMACPHCSLMRRTCSNATLICSARSTWASVFSWTASVPPSPEHLANGKRQRDYSGEKHSVRGSRRREDHAANDVAF